MLLFLLIGKRFYSNYSNSILIAEDSARNIAPESIGGKIPSKYCLVLNNDLVRIRYLLVYSQEFGRIRYFIIPFDI